MLSHFLYFSLAIGYIFADYTERPSTFDHSCSVDGKLTKAAVSCENKLDDDFCTAILGPTPVAGGERNPACYQAYSKVGAIATCAKTCGFCCLTPEHNCANTDYSGFCDTLTEAQCKDPVWRSILAEDCPATCGLCLERSRGCPDGEYAMGPIVDGVCPNKYTVGEGTCCGGQQPEQPHPLFPAPCIAEVQLAPCFNSSYGDTCGARNGYACNTGADGAAPGELTCCPTVDYTNPANIIGPAILGPDGVTYECPVDYTAVMVDGEQQCVRLTTSF